MSFTPAPPRNYRWTILSAGVLAQGAYSAILLGLPAIAPAIQDRYELSLPQVGVVVAPINIGWRWTKVRWGLLAQPIRVSAL